MTTTQIAERLIQLCKAGDYDTCYDELFSPDVVSVGPAGSPEEQPTIGIDALKQKGEKRASMMQEFLGGRVGDYIVASNTIAVAMGFEALYHGENTPRKEEEIVVYTVQDGKIVREEYFYEVTPMDKS